MKHRFTAVFIAVLLALTVFAAAWHLTTRTENDAGTIIVAFGDSRIKQHIDALTLSAVQGETVNAKGDVAVINAQGLSLPDLLESAGAENAVAVTAVATDEYSARLTCDEFDRAYIIHSENDTFQMIVFGDSDSRRNVRNLAEVIAE